jgi:cytochrome c oxidase cbb3-type subunit 2
LQFSSWPNSGFGVHRCVRYSFTIAASVCAAVLAGESAFGQMLKGETAYDAAKARDSYIANCSACHQANGEGLAGVFPPLKASGVVNKDDAAKHIHIILDGMQGAPAGGVLYTGVMPPFAGTLGDDAIADIINYERASWGNHGKPVTAAQVAAERALAK